MVLLPTGGIQGVAYTRKEHRGNCLIWVSSSALTLRDYQKGAVVSGETPKRFHDSMEQCGYSHGLVLRDLGTFETTVKQTRSEEDLAEYFEPVSVSVK